jgi:GNAT superfamily N-acetyltransferase
LSDLFDVIDQTWPAAGTRVAGGWLIREGCGGGRRVSAASALDGTALAGIGEAESALAELGQPLLFRVRQDEDAIDAMLAERGYLNACSVTLYTAPLARLISTPPVRMTTFPIWPPLAIMTGIWAEGGIGPARQAIMERATVPKTAILGRAEDRTAGAAYVAVSGPVAMVHALFVLPALRRRGLGANLMRAAAAWAAGQGARQIALAVEDHNLAAGSLYRSLGMATKTGYHYRARP